MSDIVLSAGVRQNLLALQNTAQLMSLTQNRLATGKKVNTALDNPTNFFTSQALSNRAGDLNSLLDSIGQAQQTLKAADQGITSLTKLVESAKSIAKQAMQATPPSATYSLAITGNTAIAADTSRAISANTVASQVGSFTGSVKSTYTIDATSFAGATDGDTVTLSNGATTVTLEFDNDASVTGGNVGFTDAASLKTALQNAFGPANVTGTTTLTVTGTDYTTSFAVPTGTASLTGLVTRVGATDGDKLTLTQGATTATFRYVASGASAAEGTFTTVADLISAIHASNLGNSSPTLNNLIHASGSGTLQLESNAAFSVGGTIATALNFGGSSFNGNYNSTLAGLTGALSVKVGAGAPQVIDFTTVTTRAALSTALSNLSGVTATINGSNQVSITSTTADNVTISGTGNAASGLFDNANIGANTPTVATGATSAARASLQTQYNDLLTQIDQLAKDAGYNGINLLNGDDLKVIFNEQGTSFLTIASMVFDSNGLGLLPLVGSEFQTNTSIDTIIADLDGALATLRTQASNLGTNLTTVQTRQEFTKNLIAVLQTGADNLVLADSNEEGANMLALQTRQQLSTTALALSSQADQAVLRLFG